MKYSCPACGGHVEMERYNGEALCCPHCTDVVCFEPIRTPAAPPIIAGERGRAGIASGCAVLAGIGSVILGIWWWSSLIDRGGPAEDVRHATASVVQHPVPKAQPAPPPTNSEAIAATPEPDHGGAAYYFGKAACEKALKSPSTAKFSWLGDEHTGWQAYGYEQWKVFGQVDAQNSFGAMLRQNWLAVVKRYGGFYRVVYMRLGDDESGPMPGAAASPIAEPTESEKLAAEILREQRAETKRREADEATLKFHLERAQAGNDISQRRLADIYMQRGYTNTAAAWLRAAATNSPPH